MTATRMPTVMTDGSFDCTCLDGYEGDGVIQCASMTNLHIIG